MLACLSPSISQSLINVQLYAPFAIAPAPISHPCITSPTREAKRCLADSGSPNHPIRSTTSTIARCSVTRVWLDSPRLVCGTTLHLVRHATPHPPAFCQLRRQRLFNLQTDSSTHDAGIDRGPLAGCNHFRHCVSLLNDITNHTAGLLRIGCSSSLLPRQRH